MAQKLSAPFFVIFWLLIKYRQRDGQTQIGEINGTTTTTTKERTNKRKLKKKAKSAEHRRKKAKEERERRNQNKHKTKATKQKKNMLGLRRVCSQACTRAVRTGPSTWRVLRQQAEAADASKEKVEEEETARTKEGEEKKKVMGKAVQRREIEGLQEKVDSLQKKYMESLAEMENVRRIAKRMSIRPIRTPYKSLPSLF